MRRRILLLRCSKHLHWRPSRPASQRLLFRLLVLLQWAGVRLIQDPKGKYARRLVAVFRACPPPAENRGLSLSTRSKAMSASAQGTSVPSLFSFEEKPLRAVVIDGEPWFVAADVCKILELGNPTNAVAVLDEDERTLTLIKGANN